MYTQSRVSHALIIMQLLYLNIFLTAGALDKIAAACHNRTTNIVGVLSMHDGFSSISLGNSPDHITAIYIGKSDEVIIYNTQAKRCSTSQGKHLQLHMPQQRIVNISWNQAFHMPEHADLQY